MRLNKFRLTTDYCTQVGLKDIEFVQKALGPVVALVGKNGSGKSRVLNAVADLHKHITNDDFENGFVNILNNEISYRNFDDYAKMHIKVVDFEKLKTIQDDLNSFEANKFPRLVTNSHLAVLSKFKANVKFSINDEDIIDEFQNLNKKSTVKYIQDICDQIIQKEFKLYMDNKSDPTNVQSLLEETEEFKILASLQKYIKIFLNKNFEYLNTSKGKDISSKLNLNNEIFDFDILSPGEKTLFSYAILFFYMEINSKNNISDSIIIIDEPELHLHPASQIQLIKALIEIISENGQLWIGTHSLPILSILNVEDIFLMQDSSLITPSRLTPGKAVSELFEFEPYVFQLSNFLTSLSEWSYANFMDQCFNDPESLFADNKDEPQYKLFAKFITSTKIKSILDFGAGKGRIGTLIAEDEKLSVQLEYNAFCYDITDKAYLEKVPLLNKIYYSHEEMKKDKFDCIILINVLHEIDLEDWLSCFDTIKECLSDDGYLLILEDSYLPKGEKANKYGYILLDVEHMAEIFDTKNHITMLHPNPKYANRLQLAAFQREEINHSPKSMLKALESVKETKIRNLKELRSQEKTLYTGRRYANESQIYINTILAIENME